MPSKKLKLEIFPATNGNMVAVTNQNIRNKLVELIKLMAAQEAMSVLVMGGVK